MSNNLLKGVRYQKRINIGKFLRINISKTGIGLSLGKNGLRYTRGPSGSFLTVGLPGSGISYRKKLSNKKGFQFASLAKLTKGGQSAEAEKGEEATEMVATKPGFFAPSWEKLLFKAIQAYKQNDLETTVTYLQKATNDDNADLGVSILLAFILAQSTNNEDRLQAIALLEEVVTTDEEFPTDAITRYMQDITLDIDITPQVEVTLSMNNALASSLMLVELYQDEEALEQAINLLEEIDDIIAEGNQQTHSKVLILSLFELYLITKNYQAIIDRANIPNVLEDDVMLGSAFFYGRALQEQNLHTAAIQVYNKCLRRKKGFNPNMLQACRLWRALSFLRTNKKARARKELERVLGESPSPEIKKATWQALRLFWPDEFSTNGSDEPKLLSN